MDANKVGRFICHIGFVKKTRIYSDFAYRQPPCVGLLKFSRQSGALVLGLVLLVCSANAQTPATGTITISGDPACAFPAVASYCDTTPGYYYITVNGETASTGYTYAGSILALATTLANAINADIPIVTATVTAPTIITLTTKATGSGTNYPFSVNILALGLTFPLSTSGPTLTGGTDLTVQGYINPKYLIMGVTYAPPGGSASSVSYQTTNVVGNTSTITNSFTEGVSVSISLSAGGSFLGFIKGKSTATESSGWTQKTTKSDAITITKTSSTTLKTPGVPNVYSPVNHDYDIVWLWLNPVVLFTFDLTTNTAVWNGDGYDLNDPLQDVDVWPVYVGYLNGDFRPLDAQDADAFSRSWVTTQTFGSGQGPAITSADFPNILGADPFAYNPSDQNTGYLLTLAPDTNPPNSTDGRFTASTPGNATPQSITYAQAPPNSTQGIQSTYQSAYSTSTTVTQTSDYTYTAGFGLDVNVDANFLDLVSASGEFKKNWNLTWENISQTSNTSTNTQTDTAIR